MSKLKFEYKITALYLIVGFLWILFSDKVLLYFIKDTYLLTELQTFKGWFYVLVTAVFLYLYLKDHLVKLRNAEQKAKENDRLKSAFLQNISHEIRTPMNGIIGFASLLNDPTLTETQKSQFLEIITKSSHQLLKTINDLLDISLIETGSLKIYENKIHLNKLLEEICRNNKPLMKEDIALSLELGLPDEQCIIISDEQRISQVLNNLLNNANKFTEEGHVKFGYTLRQNELEFYVEDTGIGINTAFHEKIFEHFLKAELENSRLYEGVGLGLAICKGNVDLLQGKIRVESEIGKGSIFFFTLPYKTEKAPVITINKITTERKKAKKLTLLVVEDDQSNYMYIKQIFHGTDSTIYHALNGKEAFEICKRDSDINLVLMDIKMPVMNGIEATKIIKEIRPELAIVAQTAFAVNDERELAINAGCIDYISKPFRKEQIISLIENLN